MSRAIAILLFVAILAPLTVLGQETALLGEMVPWPILSTEISMHPMPLYDHPLEEHIAPAPVTLDGAEYSYGILPLGSGPDPGITVAVSQHGEPRILVDANNDEDLANDPGIQDRERINARTYRWQVTVDVEYKLNGTITRAPYHLLILADFSYATEQYEYWYSCFCHRRGLVDLGGTLYPVAITDLSSTAKYDDLSHIFVSIDTDGNGELDMLLGSHEVYGAEDPFQVQVGDVIYVITSVSEDGRRMTLERVGNAEPRPIIGLDHPAPDFAARTIDGQDIRLSDFRGKVVVLVFCPVLKTSGCQMCDTISSSTSSRLSDIRDSVGLFGDNVVMITVYAGSKPVDSDDITGPRLQTEITLWDPQIAEIYRRSNGLFIIDQEGIIAGMDEAWASIRCGMPRGGYRLLRQGEIQDIIANLLSRYNSH